MFLNCRIQLSSGLTRADIRFTDALGDPHALRTRVKDLRYDRRTFEPEPDWNEELAAESVTQLTGDGLVEVVVIDKLGPLLSLVQVRGSRRRENHRFEVRDSQLTDDPALMPRRPVGMPPVYAQHL